MPFVLSAASASSSASTSTSTISYHGVAARIHASGTIATMLLFRLILQFGGAGPPRTLSSSSSSSFSSFVVYASASSPPFSPSLRSVYTARFMSGGAEGDAASTGGSSIGTMEATAERSSVIIDTDMGFDDMLAIGSLLLNRNSTIRHHRGSSRNVGRSSNNDGFSIESPPPSFKIELVTTVCGICPSPSAAVYARRLLPPSVVVVEGSNRGACPIDESIDPWLFDYRRRVEGFASDRLVMLGIGGDDADADAEADNYAEGDDEDKNGGGDKGSLRASGSDGGGCCGDGDAMIEALEQTLKGRPDASVDVLCLGPLTNVALWLRRPAVADLLEHKVRAVWIMGGNLPSLSSTSFIEEDARKMTTTTTAATKTAEFNFRQDPAAAAAVLSSPRLRGKLRIVTEDVSEEKPPPPASSSSSSTSSSAASSNGTLFGLSSRVADAVMRSATEQRRRNGSGSDFFGALLSEEKLAVYYDPVCAYALANEGSVDFVRIRATVDEITGLVRVSSLSSSLTMDDGGQGKEDGVGRGDSSGAADNAGPGNVARAVDAHEDKISFVSGVKESEYVGWLTDLIMADDTGH